ncbi:MAG: ABC transporter substrate-binding protein [Tissierellia bacterium]|nr:ABC transporter substrate-binding protein [Tissierellia bacterium]
MPKRRGLALDDGNSSRIENPRQVVNDKGLLKIAIDQVYNPLNPFYESSIESSLASKLLHRSLFKITSDGRLEADLAKTYWYKNDGKDIHILLKEDQEFGDKTSITSDDIINNIKVLADPSYNGVKSYYVEGIGGYFQYKKRNDQKALRVFKEDDNSLVVQFSNASKENLKFLTMPIVALDEEDIVYGDLSRLSQKEFLYGAGNYRVKSHGDETILFEKISGDKDIVKEIFVNILPYYEAKLLYQRGSIDMIYKYQEDQVQVKDFDEKQGDFTYFIRNQDADYVKMTFNTKDGFFADDRMRLALRDSIDFDQVLNLREEEKISSPIYKSMAYYEEKTLDKSLDLRELVKDLEDKKVSLAIYRGLQDIISRDEAIVQVFKDVGLDLEITYIDENNLYQLISESNPYDILISQDQLFTIPTIENQSIYNSYGQISDSSLYDNYNARLLGIINDIWGYDNYEFALKKWQNWYHTRLPYISLKGKNQISVINKRIQGLQINEFVGLEDEDNLRIINNLLK